jgi:hypothetical protein
MRKDALRTVIETERELNKARKRTRAWEGKSKHPEGGNSGSKTFSCPQCGAPVVDSEFGRNGHAYRMPGCRKAMEAV